MKIATVVLFLAFICLIAAQELKETLGEVEVRKVPSIHCLSQTVSSDARLTSNRFNLTFVVLLMTQDLEALEDDIDEVSVSRRSCLFKNRQLWIYMSCGSHLLDVNVCTLVGHGL